MTSTFHKVAVTIASIATGIGAFLIGADPDSIPFDTNPEDVGLTLIWIGTIVNIVATVIRANWLPGVTTGVGLEK